MKRFLIALFFVLLSSNTLSGFAQSPAASLDQLTVDIWPDYDRPQVLVLLTGLLPENSLTPATVTVPVPEEATINAVARITPEGAMIADIDFDDSVPGQLTLTTPDATFRIEYYMPYAANGNSRNFVFDWKSNLSIGNILTTVQQPALAEEMNIDPSPTSVTTGRDGLQYHELPTVSLASGDSFSLEASYQMSRSELTTEVLTPQEVPLIGSEGSTSAVQESDDNFDWLVVAGAAGVIILVAVGGWFVISSRSRSQRVTKPRPVRQSKPKPATKGPAKTGSQRFCHECGQPVDADDRFCSSCGAAQKNR